MGKCQEDCGIPQPSLQSEDMPQKPLDVSTPLFYPRAEEQQASLPGEQLCDTDAAWIDKSVRVCSNMVHHKIPRTKLRGIFLLLVFEGTAVSVYQRGREWLAAEVTAACSGNRKSVGQWYVPARKNAPVGHF